MTFKSRPASQECEGVSHADTGDKSNPGRANGKCKGPEVRCLSSRNSEKEAGENEEEW